MNPAPAQINESLEYSFHDIRTKLKIEPAEFADRYIQYYHDNGKTTAGALVDHPNERVVLWL